MSEWHEQDSFWETMAPKMFSQERWDSASAEVGNIISLLELDKDARILDLCCGPGRHSLELARRGFQVTAVDRTLKYIEEARKKSKVEGLDVEFVQEDMRNYVRPNTFNVIVNLYTSFGYFDNQEEDEQTLRNVFSSLNEHGKFLIDIMGKEVLARIFRDKHWYEIDGAVFLDESKITNGWSRCQNRWIMIKGEERKEFIFSHRIYSGEELTSLLTSTGFNSIELYGDLTGTPYDDKAKRLIATATK